MDSQNRQQLQDDIQGELSESLKEPKIIKPKASFLQKDKAVLIADGGGGDGGGGTMDPPRGTEEITPTMTA